MLFEIAAQNQNYKCAQCPLFLSIPEMKRMTNALSSELQNHLTLIGQGLSFHQNIPIGHL